MLGITSVKVTRTLGKATLLLKRYSPEILTGLGVVGSVASGVLLVKAGMQTEEILDRHKSRIEDIKADTNVVEQVRINKAFLTTGRELTALYGPPVVLGVASIASIVGGHRVLRRRNIAIAAAYKALETSFDEYRSRIADERGEEAELDIYHNAQEIETVDEKGKKKVVSERANGLSPYAKVFDQLSSNWDRTPEYNLFFLRAQQDYFNQRLHAVGHVFLNEVYDALDIPRTPAGQVVGWLVGEDGDDYISFGLYDMESESAKRFINGYESAIWLDFNVDGPIMDRI